MPRATPAVDLAPALSLALVLALAGCVLPPDADSDGEPTSERNAGPADDARAFTIDGREPTDATAERVVWEFDEDVPVGVATANGHVVTLHAPAGVAFSFHVDTAWEEPTDLDLTVLLDGAALCGGQQFGPPLGPTAESCAAHLAPLATPSDVDIVLVHQVGPPSRVHYRVSVTLLDLAGAATPDVEVLVHRDGRLVPDALPAARAAAIHPTGFPGSEPTVGVTASGAIFLTQSYVPVTDTSSPELQLVSALAQRNNTDLIRSTDGGLSWERVTPGPAGLLGSPYQFDPWLHVDETTGRVYSVPGGGNCAWLSWSDDDGASWDVNPLGGCDVPEHDFHKLVAGPPPEGVETRGYPSVLYYSYNPAAGRQGGDEGARVTTSLDGGVTWRPNTQVFAHDMCTRGLMANVATGPDGTALASRAGCDHLELAVSTDAGQTWTRTRIDDVGAGTMATTEPAIADDGTMHVAWVARDGATYHVSSRDGGATWSAPERATPGGIAVTHFPAIATLPDGTPAIAFLGARERGGTTAPHAVPGDTPWHLYVTLRSADGSWTTQRLTPADDPVHRGCIHQFGGACTNRALFDFIDMVERDGALYVGVADACDACTRAAESTHGEAVLYIVSAASAERS